MTDLLEIELIILGMLLITSIVSIVVRRVRIPYTVALVLVGVLLSLRPPVEVVLTSELILGIFLPPLLFEAAFHLNLAELRRNVATIAILAVPGVILTMLVVGGILFVGPGLAVGMALIFGALIAATDPVSVVAIFRRLGAPKQLEVLLEGESLFNDGTAVVLFSIALAALGTAEFSLLDGVIEFFLVAGGGIIVGFLFGWVVQQLTGRIDDHLVETTFTTLLAFGSYLVAEQFGVSGVLAVVTAGLVNGNLGQKGMSPTTRIVVLNFWEYVAFLANSAIFLLIGLSLDLPALLSNWQLILWAILGVLIARAINIYGLSRLGRPILPRWRHVMFWGGLRGAIALALALSLPPGRERQAIIAMTFGVVLFTLLAQGLSMDWLVKRLRLVTRTEENIEYELRRARALAARSGYEHMQRLYQDGLISLHTWERMRPVLKERSDALADAVQEALQSAPGLEADEINTARREELRARRTMLADLRRDGVIADETYEQLVTEVDAALEMSEEAWAAGLYGLGTPGEVRQLMTLVIQDRDLEAVSNALSLRNIPSTRIKTTGAFLAQRNHTLLVGLREDMLEQAVAAVNGVAKERVEYVSAFPGDQPSGEAQAVHIRGATIFVFDVERFEVI
ncbi:MAG: Na+/H+ antiporter [Anaerolineae bacterium]|nr:MAG: Na+/H+ antiporter [Anaerolineae bacterium]